MNDTYDITIIGGGIIGTATALTLLKQKSYKLLLLEAESSLAAHQTGNNSGVIHSGLYYKPGSLKARNCAHGREMMYSFCEEHNLPFERCGKVVIATSQDEIPALNLLEERGIANGLAGIKRLSSGQIKEYEPYTNGVEGLFVPQTGIVDYTAVTNKYAELIEKSGCIIKKNSKVISVDIKASELILTTKAQKYKTKFLVNCGGLYSDRIAKLCGVNPEVMIIPFRGEYYKIKKEKRYLVKNLIYPVPDLSFPFLGVHFTRMINDGVEAGPNAVLALKREGYKKTDFSFRDVLEMKFYSGFWKMASKYYKMGLLEFRRSFSKNLFVKSLQKLIPEIQYDDIESGGSGVRAQALDSNGKLVDDFKIVEAKRMIHILNAPSPAATASLSIGKTISDMIIKRINEEVI
ncbi:MAG TPA: L-2-hydroxyglutarate oxidase [Ignavibacteriaceae bacterium]|nr:MAG: L-2-hydroxyglutarate oxidase LhgO [Ignavibacteria bacterium ADurb.Bin266]OQY73008.1 MAG: hydroxyglutarate oxidase [Ignavibacteriales bacterium UTCHB2]HQF41359.1 L-2-hydroxyglutarate oxidase [Ignavibacteriaceae bacterium]HQI41120.1 L-2-hydroxyglutarate oxidase [Ignavibacteriaceae bacterium]HQJ45326.1 L-2-hydroxyglutarate oxidase [Ignavibacteriaceae bacterium]